MKSNGKFRIASSRLHTAISALPNVPALGIAATVFVLSASGSFGQTTISSGQNLLSNDSTVALGALTRNAGGTLLVSGTGAGSLSASATLTNGILPWALIQSSGTAANNSSAGYTFATVSGGNLVAYTSATQLQQQVLGAGCHLAAVA